MHFSYLLVFPTLALRVTALTTKLASRADDDCLPLVPTAGTYPKDLCATTPQIVGTAAAFGVVGQPRQRPIRGYDWSVCNSVTTDICNQMAAPDTVAGRWYFKTGPAETKDGPMGACQMGFYLPYEARSKTGDPNAASEPALEQCSSIFNAILSESAKRHDDWLGASVNLLSFPATAEGQFVLPGGKDTGVAVNSGYPSYFVASDPTWGGKPPPAPAQKPSIFTTVLLPDGSHPECYDINIAHDCPCERSPDFELCHDLDNCVADCKHMG